MTSQAISRVRYCRSAEILRPGVEGCLYRSSFRSPFVFVALGALCALPRAGSAEFAWAISGSAESTGIGDVVEIDTFAISATYHFGGVDDSLGPYSLAAFPDRRSRLSVVAIDKNESSNFDVYSPFTEPIRNSFELDTSGYALSGRYVWRQSGWYVGAGAEAADTDWRLMSVAASAAAG